MFKTHDIPWREEGGSGVGGLPLLKSAPSTRGMEGRFLSFLLVLGGVGCVVEVQTLDPRNPNS